MAEWVSRIHVFCFASCYVITLVLEASRLFFRAPIRVAVMIGVALVGLVAHTLYLGAQAVENIHAGQAPFSSWYYWCLIGAWIVAAMFVVMTFRRPQGSAGLFLLPLLVVLIAVAGAFGNAQPFPPKTIPFRWGLVHGLTLLLGTITIVLGFVAGVLYLWQAWRLKHKIPTGRGFRLPSLELLQRLNVQSLYLSAVLLAVGVLSGIVLILRSPASQQTVSWTDPVVIASLVLIAWLIAAVLFELLYRPARQGQKVAYLTVASFVIFGLVMGFLLAGSKDHAMPGNAGGSRSPDAGSRDERTAAGCHGLVRAAWPSARRTSGEMPPRAVGTEWLTRGRLSRPVSVADGRRARTSPWHPASLANEEPTVSGLSVSVFPSVPPSRPSVPLALRSPSLRSPPFCLSALRSSRGGR